MSKYKKIAKNLLIENAWDRKFGEPLPTLEDVMKEAESMQLQPKGGGKTVKFTDKNNYEKAKKSGDYEEPEETDDGGEKEDPSGKLGAGDFDRDGDRSADAGDDKGGEPEPEDEEPSGEPEAGKEEPKSPFPHKDTGNSSWYDDRLAKKIKKKEEGDPLSSDYDSKKASEDFEEDREYMLGRRNDDGSRQMSDYKSGLGYGGDERRQAKKRKEEWDNKKEKRGQRATAIASGEVVPNSPEDSNMALDYSKQAINLAKEKLIDSSYPEARQRNKLALKKAKDSKKAVKTAIKQQAKKQGWKTSFVSGRVKTENVNSVTINGKTYKKIQEQKKVTDKHPLRETYEKIGGK